jgi:hypothetical protein
MWYLLIPAAAVVGAWLYGAHKVATKAPPLQHDPEPNAKLPTSGLPGTGTVDGKGTGLIDVPPNVAIAAQQAANLLQQQPKGSTSVGLPTAAPGVNPITAANLEAAVKQAALQMQQDNAPTSPTVVQQAALAAEALKMQAITALNTPEADRTPEQSALLLQLGALPVFAS